MLKDVAIKHLKPKEKNYKVADRDGMYVLVRPSGTLTFQLDYPMNRRRVRQVRSRRAVACSRSRAVHRRQRAVAEGRPPRSKRSGKSAVSWKPRASASSARSG